MRLQRSKGLGEPWLAQIPSFLARHRPRPPHRLAIVHSELGPGHVLYQDGAISGVIDFADACVGDPDLEPRGARTLDELAHAWFG